VMRCTCRNKHNKQCIVCIWFSLFLNYYSQIKMLFGWGIRVFLPSFLM
jgi:hypothetical protein